MADGPVILDAGCGARAREYPPGATVVGIDMDGHALARNTSVDEKIIGDLQSHQFERDSFELIYCHGVLDHLPHPELALQNMAQALRPGGQIEIGMTNPSSRKGLLTKWTPYRLHLWVYRTILRSEKAGQPGYGPYRTFLRLSRRKLVRFARANALDVSVETHRAPAPRNVPTLLWHLLGRTELRARIVKRHGPTPSG